MKEILAVRKKIDEIDTVIFRLLKKRYDLINKITLFKQKNSLEVVQKKRETNQFKNLNKLFGKDKKAFGYIKKIFRNILKESKNTQKKHVL